MFFKRLILSLLFINSIFAWDNIEFELFDLVEEVNENFYDVLKVSQSSSSSEIRRAFRKLSLQIHPDKSDAPDAAVKFRQLVAINEILKDSEKRARYDLILKNGLPDWRQPVYYYRRVRKMGLVEMSILLMIILTVVHFFVTWAIYFEHRYEREELYRSVLKRKEKKARKAKQKLTDEDMEEELQEELQRIPRPEMSNILPFLMLRLVVKSAASLPSLCATLHQHIKSKPPPVDCNDADEQLMELKLKRRKRVETPDAGYVPQMAASAAPVMYTTIVASEQDDAANIELKQSGQEWTQEELTLLSKAVNKFPSGTARRWEKIAEMTNRTVQEVTLQAKKMKSDYAIAVETAAQGTTGAIGSNVKIKKGLAVSNDITIRHNSNVLDSNALDPDYSATNEKTLKADSETHSDGGGGDAASAWTQNQQKILEWALTNIGKSVENRWERIAEHIPGKSKEDCILRYKYLAALISQRKQAKSAK